MSARSGENEKNAVSSGAANRKAPPGSRSLASPPRRLGTLIFSLLSVIVGVVAGAGAVLFRGLIAVLHNLLLLGRFSFVYDANTWTPRSPWGAGVILVPVLGAIAVAWLVVNFAPEARGHGVPEVMDAIHYQKGVIRPVVAVIKSLASAISIGSGGSVGREGPIIQIGASFGSTLAQTLRLAAWERMTLIACGAGGGIAATFNTPVGGLLFAVEIMMHEVSARTLVPVIISTATATYIGRVAFGTHPSFVIPSFETLDFKIQNLLVLVCYAGLGILVGLLSTLFIRTVYWFEDIFEKRVGGSYYRQHMIGMAFVGLLFFSLMQGFGHYYTEGVGYSAVQEILTGWKHPAMLLLLLCAAKLLATGLTLGSGGSGGIFSPALFLGATLGSAYGLGLARMFPAVAISPQAFAVAGMAGMVGGSTGAALAAIVMIFEMTLNYNVIIPLTLTVAIAWEVRKALSPESIYTFKLVRRGHRMPDALETNAYYGRRARDLMNKRVAVVEASLTPAELRRRFVDHSDVEYLLLKGPGGIGAVMPRGHEPIKNVCQLGADLTLLDSLKQMHHSGASIGIVSDGARGAHPSVQGVITREHLANALAESIEHYDDAI
ncbi:MAG TPA: chloride channel protein [Bryobacteraceae bacterium]|nr:chloride channel protein [Bryobacteraceae bacterium]